MRVAGESEGPLTLPPLRPFEIGPAISLLLKMKRLLPGLMVVYLLLCLGLTQPVEAQAGGRRIRLTVFLDYAHAQTGSDGTVIFDGTVKSPGGAGIDLRGLGFMDEPPGQLKKDEKSSSVRGSIRGAALAFPQKDGWYHLRLGPLDLSSDDHLTLILPFVNLDYEHITPRPDNLADLIEQAARPPSTAPILFEMRYGGTEVNGVAIDIPFTSIRKRIDLVLTPLIGEMLFKPSPGFHLSGKVVFDQVRDYGEFSWDCPADPARQVQRYNNMHLLFGLDSPPFVITAGLLSMIYQYKPTYTFVRMDPSICSFDAQKGGQIEAAFNGQISSQSLPAFPQNWGDTLETNRANGADPRVYTLEMGDVVLAPGDVLTVSIPGAAILNIDPPPTRMNSTQGLIHEIIYEGPLYSKIQLDYQPEPGLILSQLHSAARVWTKEIEQMLGPAMGANNGPIPQDWHLTALVGLLGVVLLGARTTLRIGRLRRWIEVFGWELAALALFYGLRSVYGLFVAAVLIYLNAGTNRRPSLGYFGRGVAGLLLVLVAMRLDQLAARYLFDVLRTLDFEITPATPLILLILGMGLAALFAIPARQVAALFPEIVLAIVLALIPLAVSDAIQKSLISLAILGIGIAYLFLRLKKINPQMDYSAVIARLKMAWNNPLIPIGFVLLILFAAQNGLQSSSAVFGSLPAVLRALLPPFLLLISILTSYLAAGLLFIILYPILPFRSGYLKAAAFGLFLLLIFLFGIGANENLASTWQTLITGRIVYYSGVPLLIGLFFEITTPKNEPPAGASAGTAALDAQQTARLVSERFKDLRSLLSTLGSIATLVAPGLYAYFAHAPLLINYFDLVETLLRVTAVR